jgi:hypothetical protein
MISMKRFIVPLFTILVFSCSNEASYKKATDAQEAAREFIRASLDGNYDKANFYLFHDSLKVNEMLLDKWKSDYSHWSQEDKVGHKEANIIVITTDALNDSTLNYVYSNSYKKDTTTIKIIRYNGDWLVDLKDIH